MSVLNPSHSQIKNEILRKQGNALKHLCDYVQALKDVDELKNKLTTEEVHTQKIRSLFV